VAIVENSSVAGREIFLFVGTLLPRRSGNFLDTPRRTDVAVHLMSQEAPRLQPGIGNVRNVNEPYGIPVTDLGRRPCHVTWISTSPD
jgi:hypothetical protein